MSQARNADRNPAYTEAVGAAFAMHRKTAGFSRAEVSAHLGMNTYTLKKYETGETNISASTMHELCGVIGMPTWHIFRDAETLLKQWSKRSSRK